MEKLMSLLIVVGMSLIAQQVETDVYLTGAWGYHGTQAALDQYEKAGFTMVQYGVQGRLHDKDRFHYISGVAGNPPRDAARPFETADGKLLNSVGLFTHVNFNAPTVEDWWKEYVPKAAADKSDTDRIAFWKVHNEFGYHSGELFDYSEGSVAKYRKWLKERYGSIEKLNAGWQSQWASFDMVEPPRKDFPKNLPNWLDWRRFTAWNFARYFHDTGELIRTKVPNAKVSDNFYITTGLDGWDLFELAKQTDYMALDIYAISRWDSLMNNMDMGRSAARAWNKPFFMMEYHAGPNNWINTVYAWQLYVEAQLAWARESRAIQWYMWNSGKSGREEGIHGILDLAGNPTERMTAVTRISAFSQRFAPVLKRMEYVPKVGVVISNDSQYYQRAMNKNQWQFMGQNQILGRMLDLANIPFAFVDAQQLPELNLDEYQALIVAASPIVSDAAMGTLAKFAASGRHVVLHDGAAVMNDFGQPRTFKPIANMVACDVKLENISNKDVDAYRTAIEDYAKMLAEKAEVKPSVVVESSGLDKTKLDIRLLKDKKLNLLFVTKTEPAATDLTLTLPECHEACNGWFYAPDTMAVQAVKGTLVNGSLQFKLSLGTNDGCGGILLFGEWQPIVDIASASGQDTFRPGEQTELMVGVVNMSAKAVSGQVTLALPEGWKATPVAGSGFEKLAAGQRTQVAYKLSVPRDAKLDFFAFENPIQAEVTFTEGVSGTLAAKMQPFVKPTLDVRVVYHDKMLNPWQELTPPILRWGWDAEVKTPPPDPMAVHAPVKAVLEIDARVDLLGKPVVFSVANENGTKGQVKISGKGIGESAPLAGRLEVEFLLDNPGMYTLTATCGEFTESAVFPAAAGTETAESAASRLRLLSSIPPVGANVGVASQRVSKGTPVKIELPEDVQGDCLVQIKKSSAVVPVAFARAKGGIEFNADVEADGTAAYKFLTNGQDGVKYQEPAPRIKCEEVGDGLMTISGDSYRITFNTLFGWIERMELRKGTEWIAFMPERTGPVLGTQDGHLVGPETSTGLLGLSYSFTPVSGVLEFNRPLDNGKVSVREHWVFEPNHMKVDIRLFNLTRAPVVYRSLVYEIGCNEKTAPAWQIMDEKGTAVREGRLPATALTGSRQMLLLKSGQGPSMAVTLRRCAQNLRWASIDNHVSHTTNLTRIDMVRSISVDPGDFILAEFDWWTSEDGNPPIGEPHLYGVAQGGK